MFQQGDNDRDINGNGNARCGAEALEKLNWTNENAQSFDAL